jgi:HTH-type transcriptional regulator/antitoxin HipB
MEQLVYSTKSLGSTLKRQRKAKKLNQHEVGEAFNLQQSTVSNIEQGAPGTRLETVFRMLAALDLEMVIRTKGPGGHKKKDVW